MAFKNKIFATAFPVLTILLVLSLSLPFQNSVTAVVVVDQDFNDGNYDDWEEYGWYRNATDGLFYPTSANFSAADNTLKATGPVGVQFEPQHNIAYIESTAAYGSWTFDILVVEGPAAWFQVLLIADSPYPAESLSAFPPPYPNGSYVIFILTHALSGWNDRPTIWLQRYQPGSGFTELDEYEVFPALTNWTTGWNDFTVTRNTTGYFEVYLNGTLALEAQDNTITTSNYFAFAAESGQAIDNVVIDDGTAETPPPPPIPGFPLTAVAIGLAAGLGVIVILRRRRT